MKKIYLLLVYIVINGFHAFGQVPNNGFENWTGGNPDVWDVMNLPGEYTCITQATPAYSGNYAAKGQPAVYASAGLTMNAVMEIHEFPITQRYANFEFHYKTSLVNGDKLYALMFLYYHAGSTTTMVASATRFINTNAATYTLASIPFNYFTTNTPDSAQVIFSMVTANGTGTLNLSSYYIVDDVTMTGVAGVEEWNALSAVQVFPVPAHDLITVKGTMNNSKYLRLMLMDATGRLVRRIIYTSSFSPFDVPFDLQGIVPGLYSLLLMTDEKTLVRRVVVE